MYMYKYVCISWEIIVTIKIISVLTPKTLINPQTLCAFYNPSL